MKFVYFCISERNEIRYRDYRRDQVYLTTLVMMKDKIEFDCGRS